MKSADIQRLLKIESDIADAEFEIAAQAERALESGRPLIGAKASKYRLDRLLKQRSNLIQQRALRLSKEKIYRIILNEREQALLNASAELEDAKKFYEQKRNVFIFVKNEITKAEEQKAREKLIQARYRFNGKERALSSWLAKNVNDTPIQRNSPLLKAKREVLNEELTILAPHSWSLGSVAALKQDDLVETKSQISGPDLKQQADLYQQLIQQTDKPETLTTFDMLLRPEEK